MLTISIELLVICPQGRISDLGTKTNKPKCDNVRPHTFLTTSLHLGLQRRHAKLTQILGLFNSSVIFQAMVSCQAVLSY